MDEIKKKKKKKVHSTQLVYSSSQVETTLQNLGMKRYVPLSVVAYHPGPAYNSAGDLY